MQAEDKPDTSKGGRKRIAGREANEQNDSAQPRNNRINNRPWITTIKTAVARARIKARTAYIVRKLNRVHGLITAVFTVILAIATVFLYCATRDLVEDAKHSGERQFIAANRPHIVLKSMHLPELAPDKPVSVKYWMVNVGGSLAKEFSGKHSIRALESTAPPAGPPPFDEGQKTPFKFGSVSGGGRAEQLFEDKAFTNEKIAAIKNGDLFLVIYGYISYRDGNGTTRATGYWRIYNPRTERFYAVPDPDYEYTE